ncbi:MAG: Calx-beta domain-containing protein [Verrucomicrobiota bacterium]
MKLQRTKLLTLSAIALLAMQSAVAAPVTTPSDGDIFLGFRAGDGQGSGVSLIVNVGNDTTFRNATPGATVNLGSVAADLSATFGGGWHSRNDFYWGFFGARNVINPPIYASRAQVPVGFPAPAFNALATNARTSTKSQIVSVTTAYQGLQATANNPSAAVQTNTSVAGSYNFQITGGTTSFGTLSQWTDIEGSFGNGAAGTALDFFRFSNTQATGDVVSRLGTFQITSSGVVTFRRALPDGVAGIRLAQTEYSVDEDAGFVTLTLNRTDTVSSEVSATVNTANGTALAGTDYTPLSNVLVTFAGGEITKTVNIPITDVSGTAASRGFTVTLSDPSGGSQLTGLASAAVTINDTDSEVQFASATVSLFALNASNTPNTAEIQVVRTGFLGDAVSVDAAITGGNLNGSYYTFAGPVTLNFAADEASKSLSIPLNVIPETALPGTIVLTLTNAQSVSLGGTATTTVTVNANPGQISFTGPTFPALTTGTSAVVTLQRQNGSAGAVTVTVNASSETLTNGTAYSYTNPTVVTFADGQDEAVTTVEILENATPGNILLTLSNPTGQTTLGIQSSTTVSLANPPSDPGVLSFATTGGHVLEEAGQVVIPIIRANGSAGAVSVTVSTVAGSAVAPGDFTALTTVVNLADGQTTASATVVINADAVKNEPNEVFTVVLTNPVGTTLGPVTSYEVRILDLDAVLPTVTITEPKANAKVTGNDEDEVVVKGGAKDNKGVAKVEVKINDGDFSEADLTIGAKGAITYELAVPVARGTNILTVRSTDYRGNVSKNITQTFIYDDPYPAIAGVYTGLVTAADGTTASNSTEGLITVTIAAKGTFSGKLAIDGLSLAFSGSIHSSGEGRFGKTLASTASLVRKGKTPLTLALDFDLAEIGNTNQVTGSVLDGGLVSELVANRSLYTNKKNPVLPLVNPAASLVTTYTVLFKAATPGNPNPEASAFPQGDGWGTVVVSNAGVAKVTGALADGSAITFSAPLSITNRLPFYVQLYSKRGSISGPVKFDNLAQTDLDGEDLFWFRPVDTKSKVYPNGWPTGITTDLIGSKFVKALKTDTSSILGFVGNGSLGFTQGTLDQPLTKGFSITAANKVTNVPADKTFTLLVAGTTGIFSGSFTAPAPQKKPAYKGVILQKSGEASGFFLSTALTGSTSQSGKVTLTEASN